MSDQTEYRITFTVERCTPNDDDFEEIGFGSSGSWGTLDGCAHDITSMVTRGEWETTSQHPGPEDVLRDMEDDDE